MGWAVGYDPNWHRDIGYGVPAYCDAPGCREEIDRGISYVCGGDIQGGEHGCGLFFCGGHLFITQRKGDYIQLCNRCLNHRAPYKKLSPEHPEWLQHKATDPTWAEWRKGKWAYR